MSIINELLDNGHLVDEAILNLRNLMSNPGWILIKRILQESIDQAEKVILDSDDPITIEDLNLIRQKRILLKEFIDQPMLIINQLVRKDIPPDNLDVYE